MPDTVQLVDPDGRARDVAVGDAAALLNRGWKQQQFSDEARLARETALEADYGGAAGAAKAIAYAGLRGLSVGSTDLLFGDEASPYRKQFPTLSTVTEFAGALGPAVVNPGSLLARATPAGRVAGIGRKIVQQAEGAGTLAKIGAGAAAAATEGAIASGGQHLSQVALGDKPLAAEGFFGAMGKGALWAAPVGGALALGERGLQRAKSLFPKSEVTREAARSVDREATDALTRVVNDGDQMLELAKQRIRQTDAQAGASAGTERATRAMFGTADPAAIENQVAQSVDKAKLTEAVDEYTRARSQFDDWVRTEADDDLEAALLRVKAPSVQVGAPTLRAPEFGEVVPPQARGAEFGEFGLERTSVGKRAAGTPGPHVPPRMPVTSELPPLPLAGDSTTSFRIEDTGLKFDPKTRTYHDPSQIPAAPALDDTSELRRAMGDAEARFSTPRAQLRHDITKRAKIADRYKLDDPGARAIENQQSAVAGDSDSMLGSVRVQNPQLGKAIDDFIPTAKKKKLDTAECSDGYCDTIEEKFRATAEGAGLRSHRFDMASDEGVAEIQRLYRLTDEETSRLTTENARRIKLLAKSGNMTPEEVAEDFYHQVSVTPDGVVIDWTANQFAKRPVPFVFRLEPETALERQLLGTQQRLASGDDLMAIGAPARAEYSAAKAVKREADAARFRDNYASSAMAADEVAMQADAARRAAARITHEALQPAAQKADAIQAALRKHVGKNVDVGADLGRAAKVIGDVEDAMAQLVDVLGPDAPSSATAIAKAYRAASATQIETLGSAAAKTADDLSRKVAPLIEAQRTVVDSDAMMALRKHDSAQAARAARQASRATAAPEAATRRKGALGVAADVGTAIEVLNAMGVRTPDISAIPVVGPVLSLYLKARAVLGVIGRKGGSVGRSTESVVAAKSAQIRDRISAATRQALDVAARGAKRAIPVAGPAGALAHRLFPGDGDVKSKDPEVLYRARMDELVRAQQPGAIEDAVADRVRSGDPDLQDAIVAQTRRAAEFLYSKAPKEGLMQSMVPTDGKWHPSRSRLQEWSRYVAAVHDPAGVLEDLANGHVTMEAAEALRVVYPKLYAEAQRTLLEHAPQMQKTLPYSRRVSLSIMFRVPVDLTMTPQHLQFLQPPPEQAAMPAGAPGGAPPPPALSAPLQIGQQTMTSLERRSGV